MKKNICFVLTNMKSGGLQRNAAILANHFNSCGHKVYLCCIYSTDCFYELEKGIEIIDFSTNKNKFVSFKEWTFKLRQFFIEKNINTVVSFGERCGILSTKSIKDLKINHILRGVNTKKNFLNSILLNRLIKKISTFVFQTEAQKLTYSKRIQNKGLVISNPFFLENKNKNEQGLTSKRFVAVASFKLSQKRQDIMLEAFKLFHKSHPDYVFDFYGECDAKTRHELDKLIKSLELNKSVRILGEEKDIKNAIIPSRAFICASTYEGMPNALIEALSIGIPTISSNWLGQNEIVSDNVNGLVFKMNDVDDLQKRMAEIADDDELFTKLSNNSISYKISSFDSKVILEKWDKII